MYLSLWLGHFVCVCVCVHPGVCGDINRFFFLVKAHWEIRVIKLSAIALKGFSIIT